MPIIQKVEENEKNKPILLIVGERSEIVDQILDENIGKFRVIFVSSEKMNKNNRGDLFSLTYDKVKIFPKLEEVIDYSIIILSSQKQRVILKPLFEKLIIDKTRTLLLLDYQVAIKNQDIILEYKKKSNIYFGILGEIISPTSNGKYSEFIKNCLRDNFRNHSQANCDTFFVFKKDAITNIYRLLFGTFRNTSLYYLYYQNPANLVMLRQKLAKINPDLNISFTDNSDDVNRTQIDEMAKQILSMPHSYLEITESGFENEISEFSRETIESEKSSHSKLNTKKDIDKDIFTKHSRREEAKQINKISFIFKSLAGGVIVFSFLNILAFIFAILIAKSTLSNIEKSNFKTVERDSLISQSFLGIAKPLAFNLFTFTNLFDKNKMLPNGFENLENTIELSKKSAKVSRDINDPETFITHEKINSLISDMYYLYHSGETMKLTQNNKALDNLLKSEYSKALSLTSVFSSFIGLSENKNYLILFQDEYEIRPTGGFIIAAGELEFENGKFKSFNAEDIFDLDGNLKESIEPPYPVKRFLQPHYYLRDSNFSLRYENSATISSQLYNLETGKKTDGVITINVKALEEILKITGPQVVAGYENAISNENLRNLLLSTTSSGDLINSLLNQLISSTGANHQKAIRILKILPELLEQKDILVYIEDQRIQKIFNANRYSGGFDDLRAKEENTINDYLYITEANIGNNKVNHNIEREVRYKSSITNNKLSSSIQISLINKSTNEDYKTYIQIAVPEGSRVDSIELDGKKANFIDAIKVYDDYERLDGNLLDEIELDQYDFLGKTIFSFPLEISVEESKTILINFDNGASIPLSTDFNYSLLAVKQPGIQPYNLTTTTLYPDDYSPSSKLSGSIGRNFVEEELNFQKDLERVLVLRKRESQ